jgi:hypothetical protein
MIALENGHGIVLDAQSEADARAGAARISDQPIAYVSLFLTPVRPEFKNKPLPPMDTKLFAEMCRVSTNAAAVDDVVMDAIEALNQPE